MNRFRHFLPKKSSWRTTTASLGKALGEETLEGTVTGASAIVVDGASTDDESTEAINGFAEDIRNMSGERIVAIAVVSTDFTDERA